VAATYAAYFADSSALVKRYVQETGTSWVRRLTRRSPSTVIYIAHITAVEVTSAVAHRRKGRTLTVAKASSILHRFRQHQCWVYPPVRGRYPSGSVLSSVSRKEEDAEVAACRIQIRVTGRKGE